MNKRILSVMAVVAAASVLSGCIIVAGGDRVVHDATTIESAK
ncbi:MULTISPECIES: hypothetical protein [unclassified Brevundimonas]|nr:MULTISPECIES: hypothetical protein [unclassified Brevundimonas]